jgi:hypothetical protein
MHKLHKFFPYHSACYNFPVKALSTLRALTSSQTINTTLSGFGRAEVACWPLIPKFAGSNPDEAVGFLKGDKNPQHTFLWKGSKIIGPMSQICSM